MAERLVVELRYKISEGDALEATAVDCEAGGGGQVIRDALLALIALGYKREAAAGMLKKLTKTSPGIDNVEEMIKKALAG